MGIAPAANLNTTSNVLFLADFLAGCLNPTSSSIVQGNPKRQVFVNTFALYAQDAWQITKRFNFNYGLRYDYEGPVHSPYPNLSIFDPSSATGLSVAGQGAAKERNRFRTEARVWMVGKAHLTPPELEPDIVLIESHPRHRTPSARMILCTLGGSTTLHSVGAFHCTRWQHNAALGGRVDCIQH